MKKQLIIAIAVFAVGFAVGYGITWLLVSGGGPSEPSARAEVPSTLKSKDAAPAAAKPAPRADAAKPAAKPEAGGADEIGTAPVASTKAPAGTSAGAKVGTKPAAAAAPGEMPRPTGQDVAAAKPKPTTWWDSCVGKTCAVDWGEVRGGISIRKGTIKHGARVDWKLRFGGAARIETVKTTQKTFTVHGVGLGLDGLPTCAEVEYTRRGKTVRGIVALKLGSKRISMNPIATPVP